MMRAVRRISRGAFIHSATMTTIELHDQTRYQQWLTVKNRESGVVYLNDKVKRAVSTEKQTTSASLSGYCASAATACDTQTVVNTSRA